MTDPINWNSMLKSSEQGANASKCGEFPTVMDAHLQDVGSLEAKPDKGSSEVSPHSPHSPHKQEAKGISSNLSTRAGEVDAKFYCDNSQGLGALVNLAIAPIEGVECGQCKHMSMMVFQRPVDRRIFHWRCTKGFNLLEAAYGGERILIAPGECDSYAATGM